MLKETYDELEECGNTFYCPQGHPLIFSRGYIVIRLRNAERRFSRQSDLASELQKRIEAMRGVQTRQRNRLLHGACPYCKQVPKDVMKHIQEKHKLK